MPAYVSILLWRVGIFNTEFGLLNQWLTALGLPKYSILDNTVTAFLACLALNLWMALPFMIATIDGALQSVDASLYESATLDGAGFFQKVRFITVPGIRAIIAPAAVMTTFITFKQFDIVYLLTQQKGYMTGSRFEHRHHLCLPECLCFQQLRPVQRGEYAVVCAHHPVFAGHQPKPAGGMTYG